MIAAALPAELAPPSGTTLGQFLSALGDPEYAFLFLEPVLIYGVFFGLVTFLFSLIVQEQKTQLFGLIIIVASCLLVGPYVQKRLAAEPGLVRVYQVADSGQAQQFISDTRRREDTKWLYYLTAALGTATIVIGAGKNRAGVTCSAATTVLASITILYGSVAHYRECRAFHPNLQLPQLVPVRGQVYPDSPPPSPYLR